jgi:hypothetical protein
LIAAAYAIEVPVVERHGRAAAAVLLVARLGLAFRCGAGLWTAGV